MKRITLFDVAEKAGVSLASVSRYLNKSGYLSAEKSDAIRAAMEELNYFPSAQAKPSNIICLLSLKAPANSFYQQLWAQFILEVQKIGKTPVIITSDATSDAINNATLPGLLDQAIQHRPTGIIVAGFMDASVTSETVAAVKAAGAPVVMFERIAGCLSLNSLTFDEFHAMSDAVMALASLGHKKIAIIGLDKDYDVEQKRLEGYYDGIRRAGLSIDRSLCCLCSGYEREMGRHAAQKLLRAAGGEITAIVCTSDLLCAGAIQAINENGLKIPDDISIISHDDAYAAFFSPPVSSIRYPMESAVATAVSVILTQAGRQEESPVVSMQLGLTMIDRNSVQRCSK